MGKRRPDCVAEALREAALFMTAPADSPRHWAVARGNLAKLLDEAIAQRQRERIPRTLSARDWEAINDALNFVLAGDWDQTSHRVTQDEMAATLEKTP